MPDMLVGNFTVFAALSAVREEAKNPLYVRKANAKMQDERMVSLYEDVVAAVVCSLEGAQKIAKAAKKALRVKMMSNDKVRMQNEKAMKRVNVWKADNAAKRKQLADARKHAAASGAAGAPRRRRRTWVQEKSGESDTVAVDDGDESTDNDEKKKVREFGLAATCAKLGSLVRHAPPAGARVQPMAPRPSAGNIPPLPIPWWVNLPVPAPAPAPAPAPTIIALDLSNDTD